MVAGNIKFSNAKPNPVCYRRPVGLSLGLHVDGACYVRGDPDYIGNLTSSVGKRVAAVPPPIDPSVGKDFSIFVDTWIRKYISPLSSCHELGFEKWIEGTGYPKGRRDQLRKVYDEFISSGGGVGGVIPLDFHKVKSFIKDESYLTYKHVRGIYSRVDGFKVLFGPLIKAIEHVVYDMKYFIKHIPVRDRPRFVHERLFRDAATYISTDYTAFESHFTEEMMRMCEMQLYSHMISYLPNKGFYEGMFEILMGQNVCQFKWLTAKFKARRMSGEMNTSLGNGFTNLMVFLYLTRNDTVADCVIEGDDCLGVVSRVPCDSEYKQLGFNVKIEVTRDLSRAAFCSMYFDVENFVNVADPIKIVMKLGWAAARFIGCSQRTKFELLKGKVMSMMTECVGAPMLQAFGLRLLEIIPTKHFRLDHLNNFERSQFSPVFSPVEVPMTSRVIVEEVFGVSIGEQLSFENYCKTFEIGPISHPVIFDHTTAEQREFFEVYVAPFLVGGTTPELRVQPTIGQF